MVFFHFRFQQDRQDRDRREQRHDYLFIWMLHKDLRLPVLVQSLLSPTSNLTFSFLFGNLVKAELINSGKTIAPGFDRFW